ncbi:MAG: hypothetical protein JWO67_4496 [Streptosporangiaceae bacterium]|nr:hypothetical protein [Streptosporangiaceae bacterium]
MTPDEIINLLSIAVSYDRRTVGEADVHAWGDAAERARWTFDDAAEAIKDYYATTPDEKPWVMPNHITLRVKAARRDRLDKEAAQELISGPPHWKVARAIAGFAARLVIPEPREPRNPALAVPCPHCGASVGASCTRPGRGLREIPMDPHPSRREAAENPRTTR